MSSILSLLNIDNANKRTDKIVISVISNEIAIDYPNYVIDVIRECKNKIRNKRNRLLKIYDEILVRTEDYLNSLKIYPRVKEFEPPSAYVLSFQKERNKVMTKNQEAINEDSLVFKIATRIQLKAGIGSFITMITLVLAIVNHHICTHFRVAILFREGTSWTMLGMNYAWQCSRQQKGYNMKVLISQYIRTLKERNELDRLLPNLLLSMSIVPLFTTQTGTRQYGVDIAAIGKDPDDGEKNYLYL